MIKFHTSQKISHSLEIRGVVAGKTGCLDLADQLTNQGLGADYAHCITTGLALLKFSAAALEITCFSKNSHC